MPDHAIFFGVLYAVLITISIGLTIVFMKSMRDAKNDTGEETHGHH